MDQTLTINLDEPVKMGEQSFSSVSLRVPRIGEVIKMRKFDDPVEAALVLLSLVSGIPRNALEQMPFPVMQEATDFLSPFLSKSPPIQDN